MPRSWIDDRGMRRCDSTPLTSKPPSFAFIRTPTGALIVPHASLRFEYHADEAFPIRVTSRNAPPISEE